MSSARILYLEAVNYLSDINRTLKDWAKSRDDKDRDQVIANCYRLIETSDKLKACTNDELVELAERINEQANVRDTSVDQIRNFIDASIRFATINLTTMRSFE